MQGFTLTKAIASYQCKFDNKSVVCYNTSLTYTEEQNVITI